MSGFISASTIGPIGPPGWTRSWNERRLAPAPPALGVARSVLPAKSWADRAVSDGRYKLWYQDGQPSRLHDLLHDPREEIDLLESQDAGVRAALKRLQEVVDGLPGRDAAPRYRLPSGAR